MLNLCPYLMRTTEFPRFTHRRTIKIEMKENNELRLQCPFLSPCYRVNVSQTYNLVTI